jgi:hypothetical protein
VVDRYHRRLERLLSLLFNYVVRLGSGHYTLGCTSWNFHSMLALGIMLTGSQFLLELELELESESGRPDE